MECVLLPLALAPAGLCLTCPLLSSHLLMPCATFKAPLKGDCLPDPTPVTPITLTFSDPSQYLAHALCPEEILKGISGLAGEQVGGQGHSATSTSEEDELKARKATAL